MSHLLPNFGDKHWNRKKILNMIKMLLLLATPVHVAFVADFVVFPPQHRYVLQQ